MKLINIEPIEDGAVTLQLSREELHAVRDALRDTNTALKEEIAKERSVADEFRDVSDEDGIDLGLSDEYEGTTLDELRGQLEMDEKQLAATDKVRLALEAIVKDHDLARCL